MDENEIKQRKLEEYKRRLAQAKIEEMLRTILEPEARGRLKRVEMANPDVAGKVIYTLISLYQSGRLTKKVSDEDLKKILAGLASKRRETKIEIRHK